MGTTDLAQMFEGILSAFEQRVDAVVEKRLRSFTPVEMPRLQLAPTPSPAPAMTVAEVAEHRRVTPDTVTKWLKDGRLKGTKQGGRHWRVERADYESFVADGGGVAKPAAPSAVDDEVARVMGKMFRRK